jgi:hypothetical protein
MFLSYQYNICDYLETLRTNEFLTSYKHIILMFSSRFPTLLLVLVLMLAHKDCLGKSGYVTWFFPGHLGVTCQIPFPQQLKLQTFLLILSILTPKLNYQT